MATGIATVDEQHECLLEIFNRIAVIPAEDASHETVLACLDELEDYTRYHFREEERLIRQSRLDSGHRTMHLQAHESFRGLLRQAREFAREHAPQVTVELLAFLTQWLLHHIMDVDRRMAHAIHHLQAGDACALGVLEPSEDGKHEVAQAVSQFTERLGKRTFEFFGQRQQMMNLQALYRTLLQCGEVMSQCRSAQEMIDRLCAHLVQDVVFDAACILERCPSGEFDILSLAGEGAGAVRTALQKGTDQEAARKLLETWTRQSPVVCNDTLSDPTLRPWHASFAEHRWLSMLALPIMRTGRMWAMMVVASPWRDCFDALAIEVCSRIAGLLGEGLDELDARNRHWAADEQEVRIARTDALTGLPNRVAIEEYLPQAIARAQRSGSLLAVGVIELEDFKPIDERYGREAADELLRCLSRRLRDWLGNSDFLAHLGGDEFVVVLEELDATQAMPQLDAALKRLHRAVETPFTLAGSETVSIDMTMGVALSCGRGPEPTSLLRKADAAMYQARQTGRQRRQWWRVCGDDTPEQIAGTSFDAFGPEAQELMRGLAPHLQTVAEEFSASFYRELQTHEESATILACLSAEEFKDLARKQADHLRFLLDAQTTERSVAQTAHRLGIVHALIGISGAWMTRAMGLYRQLLRTHLEASLLTVDARYRTLQAADARLQLDIENQLLAMQSIIDRYQRLLARPMDERAMDSDWMQGELDSLAALPGIRAAVVWRPDAQNRLNFERAAGERVDQFVDAFRVRDRYPTLDPRDIRGQGMVAATWMTDSQQETAAFAHESRSQPWQELMREFGIRSAVTLPAHRHGAVHAVLMLFGSYPNQFSSSWMHTWRLSLQNRWDLMTTRSQSRRNAVDAREAAQIRALLYGGGVEMHVQPIVNLADGALVKVEALARLRSRDGTLLLPGQFLPALGEADLDALFRQALAQGLGHLRRWRDGKLDVKLSINLAPSTLRHADCARWIEEALREAQVAPKHLTLELLESQALEAGTVDEALARLASTGVKIALDDLGAGFSNLKRLGELPFDVIKIDQNIVKDLACDPLKALSLIRTIVQIGRDLGREVVAEGLEDEGIVEAARQLGCSLGQGYGLARPMPAAALVEWVKARAFRGANELGLQSWVGALAYQWMMLHDTLYLRFPGEVASCPITDFLEAHEVHDPQVLHWHWQIHDDPVETVRVQAMRHLMQWMSGKVRAI